MNNFKHNTEAVGEFLALAGILALPFVAIWVKYVFCD